MSFSESVFFIPAAFEDYRAITAAFDSDGAWEPTPVERYMPHYFLNYIMHIAKEPGLFRSFTLKELPQDLYLFADKVAFSAPPEVTEIRFSGFSTGTSFLEVWVRYPDTNPETIASFAYRFKKAKPSPERIPQGMRRLYDVAESLVPKTAQLQLFFTAAADFKCECQCYHFLHIDGEPDHPQADTWLSLLRRSYPPDFGAAADSDCDMCYKPYPYDHWGGSSEGLVNITYDRQLPESQAYLHDIKPIHLRVDYYFMNLLLLHQRFTAIRYIARIAESANHTRRQSERLNEDIVKLKTEFAFNVVSDDQIFQNVYAKMHRILGIQSLLEDLVDNEGQLEILRNAQAARAGSRSSKLLIAISILSVFSALIDASTYFDRWNFIHSISTPLSLTVTSLVVAGCALYALFSDRRR